MINIYKSAVRLQKSPVQKKSDLFMITPSEKSSEGVYHFIYLSLKIQQYYP